MASPPLLGLEMRREFHNLTQAQMATVANVSQSQYQKFEKGGVRLDVHRAKLFAIRLNCSIDDLL
jgi:transcriptional regulator with XRE-family HTH domain